MLRKAMSIIMMARVGLVILPGGLKLFRDALLKTDDHHLEVEQDFLLMFGEDVSSKLLEKWPTTFKKKIIQECRKIPSNSDLEEHLLAADQPENLTEADVDFCWDSDLSSVLLLLHLIPPSPQGRKKPGKVSASKAEKHLKKTGTNIQRHLDAITTSTQPYLLAVGVRKNLIHQFFIILDKNAISCRSTSSLGAFDELFKAHFVFGTSYSTMLHNMYAFYSKYCVQYCCWQSQRESKVVSLVLSYSNIMKCFVCQAELTNSNTLVRQLWLLAWKKSSS